MRYCQMVHSLTKRHTQLTVDVGKVDDRKTRTALCLATVDRLISLRIREDDDADVARGPTQRCGCHNGSLLSERDTGGGGGSPILASH